MTHRMCWAKSSPPFEGAVDAISLDALPDVDGPLNMGGPSLISSAVRALQTQTVEGFWLTPCIYCGMTADSRDHFVPRSWRRVVEQWRLGVWKDAPDTVPCCLQCNSIAGAKPFSTVAAKRVYIQSRLRDKNARLLASPFHTEDDLAELGHGLRSHVERREVQRLRLLMRLSWPYDLSSEVEALSRLLYREMDAADSWNFIRRREITAV